MRIFFPVALQLRGVSYRMDLEHEIVLHLIVRVGFFPTTLERAVREDM